MGRLNLFGKEWRDIVFEGRNKSYGAYKLREDSGKNTLLALAIGLGILSLGIGSSYLYASKAPDKVIVIDTTPIMPTITDIPVDTKPDVPKDLPKQKKSDDESESLAGARTDVQKNIRFTEAVVNKDHLVTDPMAAQNEFDDETQSGQTNSEADPDNGKLKTDGSVTGIAVSGNEGNRTDVRTGASTNLDNAIVNIAQKKAIPTEGFQKFYDRFVRKFSSQSVNTNVNEVEVKLRFVVEKDGSFTDIQIIDDKFGYGEEAKRVLQTMPKWKPAEHNGKTVRSMFTLPIKIKINN